MFLRFLLWVLVFFLGYKMLKGLVSSPPRKNEEVLGDKKSKPLDLSKTDVQNARFEDIDEKKDGPKA
jgi:hypothetical protein